MDKLQTLFEGDLVWRRRTRGVLEHKFSSVREFSLSAVEQAIENSRPSSSLPWVHPQTGERIHFSWGIGRQDIAKISFRFRNRVPAVLQNPALVGRGFVRSRIAKLLCSEFYIDQNYTRKDSSTAESNEPAIAA